MNAEGSNRSRKITALAAGIAVLTLLLGLLATRHRGVLVKAYFTNVMSLRAKAPVRWAGVDVGVVKSIRIRPDMKETPAEVAMEMYAPYDHQIPNDAVVHLETDGVLGPSFIVLDATHASGPVITPNSVLKVQEFRQLTMEDAIQAADRVGQVLQQKCDCKQENATGSAPTNKTPEKSPPVPKSQ
jgi:ABC-type transporter Mla subunit MlaD